MEKLEFRSEAEKEIFSINKIITSANTTIRMIFFDALNFFVFIFTLPVKFQLFHVLPAQSLCYTAPQKHISCQPWK